MSSVFGQKNEAFNGVKLKNVTSLLNFKTKTIEFPVLFLKLKAASVS